MKDQKQQKPNGLKVQTGVNAGISWWDRYRTCRDINDNFLFGDVQCTLEATYDTIFRR